MKLERILLTTDFSPCSRAAYTAAACFARRHEATLELVHTMELPYVYPASEFSGLELALDGHTDELEAALKKEAAREAFHGLEVETRLLDSYGPAAIRDHALESRIDLVIQSSHGYSGLKHFLLGSFAERLLHVSRTPVLTFRSQETAGGEPAAATTEDRELKHILFPHDLSPLVLTALDALRFFAQLDGARVTVVHVIEQLPNFPTAFGAKLAADVDQELRAFGERIPGIERDFRVEHGNPGTVIADLAAKLGVDLICMATHGWSGFKHLLIGSVTEKLVRTAPCPIVTVPPSPGEAREAAPFAAPAAI